VEQNSPGREPWVQVDEFNKPCKGGTNIARNNIL